MPLEKRDNMGFAIHPFLIVLLIMLGAAMLVVCGAGISRFASKREKDSNAFKERTVEQDDYMREVRARTIAGLAPQGGGRGERYGARGYGGQRGR